MKEFHHEVTAQIPEQIDVEFSTTGSCGGDAGHGGDASITFKMENGGSGFTLLVSTDHDSFQLDDVRKLTLVTCGDWELEGLAIALLDLGRALLARDDVLACWHSWRGENIE